MIRTSTAFDRASPTGRLSQLDDDVHQQLSEEEQEVMSQVNGRASVEQICQSFRFKQVADTVSVKGKPDEAAQALLRELGGDASAGAPPD